MRVFSAAVLVVAVLATGAAFGLNLFQKTSAQAYATDGVRLDQDERVDLYGRAG